MADLDTLTMTLESISNLLERGFIDAYDDPAQVKKSIDGAIRERADLWSKWQTERCFLAKAEAELAALKAKIAEGPSVIASQHPEGAVYVSILVSERWEGKHVRLVVEE